MARSLATTLQFPRAPSLCPACVECRTGRTRSGPGTSPSDPAPGSSSGARKSPFSMPLPACRCPKTKLDYLRSKRPRPWQADATVRNSCSTDVTATRLRALAFNNIRNPPISTSAVPSRRAGIGIPKWLTPQISSRPAHRGTLHKHAVIVGTPVCCCTIRSDEDSDSTWSFDPPPNRFATLATPRSAIRDPMMVRSPWRGRCSSPQSAFYAFGWP